MARMTSKKIINWKMRKMTTQKKKKRRRNQSKFIPRKNKLNPVPMLNPVNFKILISNAKIVDLLSFFLLENKNSSLKKGLITNPYDARLAKTQKRIE